MSPSHAPTIVQLCRSFLRRSSKLPWCGGCKSSVSWVRWLHWRFGVGEEAGLRCLSTQWVSSTRIWGRFERMKMYCDWNELHCYGVGCLCIFCAGVGVERILRLVDCGSTRRRIPSDALIKLNRQPFLCSEFSHPEYQTSHMLCWIQANTNTNECECGRRATIYTWYWICIPSSSDTELIGCEMTRKGKTRRYDDKTVDRHLYVLFLYLNVEICAEPK